MATLSREDAIAIASRAHARDAKARQQQLMIEQGLIRKATVSLAAAGMGALKKHGTPNDIKGFPWKLALVTGATLGEALSKNRMIQSVLGGISDSCLAVYVHDAVATGSLIAGEGGEL